MNPVDYIEKYPERTKRILGINYQQWKKLVEKAIAHNRQRQKLEFKKVRINAPGAGRKPILNQKKKLDCVCFI